MDLVMAQRFVGVTPVGVTELDGLFWLSPLKDVTSCVAVQFEVPSNEIGFYDFDGLAGDH